ncbi:hypothetical protein JXO52_10170 [bacterium]|nr:hypothetical protein [bacterium]
MNGMPTMEQMKQHALRGTAADVDMLMEHVHKDTHFLQLKIADYALGLVETREGRIRMQHYLFRGTAIQKNFAALYFKRLGITDVLEEACAAGTIDAVQAFSR